jgi:hypothetical protein
MAHEWRWACLLCLMNGRADGVDHAGALLRSHEQYACPGTAKGPVEYRLRVARRADLTRAYPAEAPPWKPRKRTI